VERAGREGMGDVSAVAVKCRPIIMSAESVRAILAGRKMQTRRVVKPQPDGARIVAIWFGWPSRGRPRSGVKYENVTPPFGRVGDRLWVRETWTADFGTTFSDNYGAWWHEMPGSLRTRAAVQYVWYKADDSVYHPRLATDDEDIPALPSTWEPREKDRSGLRWRSPIHMPRWASRLTLEITDVRVQRLQDISEADAKDEGVTAGVCTHPDCSPGSCADSRYRPAFLLGWDRLNGKRAPWSSNPWVYALTFRRVEA